MTQGRLTVVVLGMLAVVLMGAPAFGEEMGPAPEKWGFSVAPYLWMASLKGDVMVKGVEGSVDATFGDILDEMDAGGSLYLEARKGVWGIFADMYYLPSIDACLVLPQLQSQLRLNYPRQSSSLIYLPVFSFSSVAKLLKPLS